MTERRALTEATIKAALAATDPAMELRLYDARLPGLLLWRRPAGKPRWYVFKLVGGRMRRLPVGEVADYESIPLEVARKLAASIIGRLAAGEDVAEAKATKRAEHAERRRGGKVPLAEALAIHLKELAHRGRDERHVAELERVVRLAVTAGVVDLADKSISAKARLWLEALDVSEPTRHRYRVHLLAVAKTALSNWPSEALPRDPFIGLRGTGAALPPPPVFTPAEAVALASDPALARPGGVLWAFLLYSGCRYKEAGWASWERINLERGTYDVVPPNAAERAGGFRVKRNKARVVALPAELVLLLRERVPNPATGFLFGDEWRGSHVRNVTAFRAHLAALGIPLDGRRIHSLRHTRMTLGIAAGEDSLHLRLSLGHAGEAMSAHYARLAMRFRGELSGWGGQLKLRDPREAARLTGHPAAGCLTTDACTVQA